VKLVLTLLVVLLVKLQDHITLHLVHVKKVGWIMVMKEIVVNVTTDVKLVLNKLNGFVEDSVLLVLLTELTTHHNVIVNTVILKSMESVYHVTTKDVKPVLTKTKIIVTIVLLTDNNTHQNVHVSKVSMKMKNKIVFLVLHTV
jgi:hypothetical protein